MASSSLTRFVLPSAQRLQQLVKLRSEIFGTTYNPDSLRTGSKVLKARLRGPAMLRYYGDRISGWKGLNEAVPNLELKDIAEEQRCVPDEPAVEASKADLSFVPYVQIDRPRDKTKAWQGHT